VIWTEKHGTGIDNLYDALAAKLKGKDREGMIEALGEMGWSTRIPSKLSDDTPTATVQRAIGSLVILRLLQERMQDVRPQ